VVAWQNHRQEIQMPGTLNPINLNVISYTDRAPKYKDFLTDLLQKLIDTRKDRFDYYESLRAKRARYANGSRIALAILGGVGVLLTTFAAVYRNSGATGTSDTLATFALDAALILYGAMGALSFFERAADWTGTYFRALDVVLAIRDLWTKFEFDTLKALLIASPDDETSQKTARDKVLELVQTLCTDIDKLTTDELKQWHEKFVSSLTDAKTIADKALDDIKKQQEDDSKAKQEAEKAAQEAAKPALLNLTINGDFDGDASILVDDTVVAQTHLKSYTIANIPPGPRKIEVRAKKGDKMLGGAKGDIFKANEVHELALTLS
jgi:hypothetical protein